MITALWGVLAVSLAVVFAVAGLIFVQRLVPPPLLESYNNTTATLFGALYVMYALMVGFSAYLVSNQFDAARKTAESEAGSVEGIYQLAGALPERERRKIQSLAESYARSVVEEGWPLMERGRLSSRAGERAEALQRGVMSFEPGTSAGQAIYAQALTLVQELDEYRTQRLLEAREGMPFILWVVLMVGGMATIVFTYLFGMKSLRIHALMVALLTMILTLILYTIHALEYPFDGIVQIGPEAFEAVLDRIEASGGS